MDFYILRELIKNAFQPPEVPEESTEYLQTLHYTHWELYESIEDKKDRLDNDMLDWQSEGWEWRDPKSWSF
jgi:hypothetical protein